MADKIEGYLEVGHNAMGDVVINLPEDKTGHIVFSPKQARALARTLFIKASVAELCGWIVCVESGGKQ